MYRFIEQPALALAMGQESRTIAERRFDVRRITARMMFEMGMTEDPREEPAHARG